MNFDISHLLESWDYQPGQLAVRRLKGKDGQDRVQMRLDLGILQMHADGRPDGKRPMGHVSLYEFFQDRLEKYKLENDDNEEGFVLKPADISRLQQEAIQYHHRYICFFQLGDYDSVLRDAERNLKMFDFVDDYAENDDLSWSLQQFRPQLLMMLTRAEGSLAVDEEDWTQATEVIKEGIEALKEFYSDFGKPELMDHSGEIQSLEQWLEELESSSKDGIGEKPEKAIKKLTKVEKLEIDLQEAIVREDYEKAAKVRDIINKLKSP